MKEREKTVLEGCSVVFFLQMLIRKLGKKNIKENSFWKLISEQPNWMDVLLRKDSDLELPKIALMKTNNFYQFIDDNMWLMELIDYVSANGKKFCFHEAELISFPPTYFDHNHLNPEYAFSQAVELFLWFYSAEKELGIKVYKDSTSFSNSYVHIISPFAKNGKSSVATIIQNLWDNFMNWDLVLKALKIRYPEANVRSFWTWVAEYRSALKKLPDSAYYEMFDMSFDNGNIDDIVPSHLKRGSNITLSQAAHDALKEATLKSGLSEREYITSLFDEHHLTQTHKKVLKEIPGLFFPVFLQLVRHYRITSQ